MIRSQEGPLTEPVLRVGLTGGIATGKSTVAAVFQEEGAFVLDADTLGHALMEPGMEAHGEIRKAFGDQVLAADGRIDRKKLGNPGLLRPGRTASAQHHPPPPNPGGCGATGAGVRAPLPGGIAVIQAALVVEAGALSRFDRIVVTHCPPEIQARRLRERDGISGEEADRRIVSQALPRERLDAADCVIDTSGSLEETRRRAREVFGALKREWDEGRKSPA